MTTAELSDDEENESEKKQDAIILKTSGVSDMNQNDHHDTWLRWVRGCQLKNTLV